ncbi:Deoxycytidine monophosphate (dCMP) deaminase, partial [Ascosphaera atra]
LCAGKRSVAEYLVRFHGFQELQIGHDHGSQDEGMLDLVAVAKMNIDGSGCQPGTPSTISRGRLCCPSTPGSTTPERSQTSSRREPIVFGNAQELRNYVVPRWRERFVTTHIWDDVTFEGFLLLPFFFLVSVDAPVTVRWERFVQRYNKNREQLSPDAAASGPPDLETFVRWNDKDIFDQHTGIARLMYRAEVRLFNPSTSLSDLHASLGVLSPDLLDEQRLRPKWDSYFMQLASLAAQRSNCMKRRVGCVLVRSQRVISTGYNGTPRNVRNCNEGGCPRCNGTPGAAAALATCLCLHAEENALLEAGRERIGEGAILYCNTCPCLTCSVKIAQLGISEVVYALGYHMDSQTALVLQEAGVKLRQFSPVCGYEHCF